jgi:hypothetical protein
MSGLSVSLTINGAGMVEREVKGRRQSSIQPEREPREHKPELPADLVPFFRPRIHECER